MQQFLIKLSNDRMSVSIKSLPFPDGDSHEFYVNDDEDHCIFDVLELLHDWHGVDIGNADDNPEQLSVYLSFQRALLNCIPFTISVDEQLMIRSVDPA